MCNCCNGANASCQCKCHRVEPIIKGLVLIIMGVLWYANSRGMIDIHFMDVIVPAVLVLAGIKKLIKGCRCGGKGGVCPKCGHSPCTCGQTKAI